jgi:hypothetical protein
MPDDVLSLPPCAVSWGRLCTTTRPFCSRVGFRRIIDIERALRHRDTTEQLCQNIARHPTPREITPQRKCQSNCRVQMRANDHAHKVDDRHHHESGCYHLHAQGDSPASLGSHDPATGGDENQQERASCLGENATPFVRRIQKVGRCLLLNHPSLLSHVLPVFVKSLFHRHLQFIASRIY